MNQLKSIRVGVDFSDCSRSALEQAVRLAKRNNARLHALHSIKPLILSDAASLGKTHGYGTACYRSVNADLVILGSKGQTNLKDVLLGSTVERLLKEIPCSVLVVRPSVPADG